MANGPVPIACEKQHEVKRKLELGSTQLAFRRPDVVVNHYEAGGNGIGQIARIAQILLPRDASRHVTFAALPASHRKISCSRDL